MAVTQHLFFFMNFMNFMNFVNFVLFVADFQLVYMPDSEAEGTLVNL